MKKRVYKAVFNPDRGKYKIIYKNPGSDQEQAVYNEQRVLVEYDTLDEALDHIGRLLQNA